jgi:AraC family transcriptional activator of tynA and feaB
MAAIRRFNADSDLDPMFATRWKHWVCEHVARAPEDVEMPGIDFLVEPATRFRGLIEAIDWGEVSVCRVSLSASRYSRWQMSARDHAPLMMVVQTKGCSVFEQNRAAAMLGPGEWGIYDTALPFSVRTASVSEHIVLMHPRVQASDDICAASLVGRRYGGMGVARRVYALAVSAFQE